ncbi:hypothetical protein BH11MYX4_BH11MYX4_51370 [soil metagenome]
MSAVRAAGWASAAVLALGVFSPSVACDPVVGTPLLIAPINACGPGQFSCDRYVDKSVVAKPQCTRDEKTKKSRCDLGKPDYPFTIVVNVPDSSYYAAGRTLVLTNNDLVKQPGAPSDPLCQLSGVIPCVRLPSLVSIEGKYLTTKKAASDVGVTLNVDKDALTSLPVRVALVPLATDTDVEAFSTGIPLQDVMLSSRLVRKKEIAFLDTISIGRYQRVAYPQPPFDAFFPPAFTPLVVSEAVSDQFVLGDAAKSPLDDPTGASRTSTITRTEGLDGWQVWLADEPAYGGRRISSIKTLSGTTATVTLHTVGANQPGTTALRQHVEIIVAPPAGWLAVPRLESAILNGDPLGFASLTIPHLQTPVTVTGVVGQGDVVLTGIPSRVSFASTTITTLSGDSAPTLKYQTSVSTDEAGRFRTVLPPGSYDVTVEPGEGTGFSKFKDTLSTAITVAKTFRPPLRTQAFGKAILADGRPLSEASVIALPSDVVLVGRAVKPRPAQTQTDADGNFRFEVDQGQYALMVEPQAGTDFPRVVQLRSFAGATADIGNIVVSPPARLALTLKDPSNIGNPIVRAVVSVYAELPGRGPPAIEMGRAMTGTDGYVEILLAQQAR